MSLIIRDMRNAILFELFDHTFSPLKANGDDVIVEVNVGPLPLLPGVYSADFWFGNRMGHRIELIDSALEFEVIAAVLRYECIFTRGVLLCGRLEIKVRLEG